MTAAQAAEFRAARRAPCSRAMRSADGESPSEPVPSNPAGSPTPIPRARPGGKVEPDLTELKEMIRRKTGRAWGELPGHLRTEILQMSQGRYRDDYARLIQLYFREIAAGRDGRSDRRDQPLMTRLIEVRSCLAAR